MSRVDHPGGRPSGRLDRRRWASVRRRCGAAGGGTWSARRSARRLECGVQPVVLRALCHGRRATVRWCQRGGGRGAGVGSGRWRAGLRAERGDTALPPLPGRRSPARVRGSPIRPSSPQRPPGRIPVSAISRTMASSRRSRNSLPSARFDQRRSSSSVSDSVTLVSSLGAFESEQWIVVDLALLGQPGREPPYAELAGAGGRRRPRRAGRRRIRSSKVPVAQSR